MSAHRILSKSAINACLASRWPRFYSSQPQRQRGRSNHWVLKSIIGDPEKYAIKPFDFAFIPLLFMKVIGSLTKNVIFMHLSITRDKNQHVHYRRLVGQYEIVQNDSDQPERKFMVSSHYYEQSENLLEPPSPLHSIIAVEKPNIGTKM